VLPGFEAGGGGVGGGGGLKLGLLGDGELDGIGGGGGGGGATGGLVTTLDTGNVDFKINTHTIGKVNKKNGTKQRIHNM
jgi:hypothetical protein